MSRNAGMLLAARVSSAVTTLLVLVLIANLRGSQTLGLVAIGFAAGQIFAVLSELGLAAFLIREGARTPERAGELLGGMLLARMFTVPVVLVGAWLLAVATSSDEPETIWLAAAGLVMQSAADLTRAASLSQRRGGLVASHAISENAVWLLVIATGLLSGVTTGTALAWGTFVLSLSILVGLLLVRSRLGVRLTIPSLAAAKVLLKEAWPFSVFSLLATAQYRLDTILVSTMIPGGSIVAAGAYFSAQRLLASFEYVPESMSLSLVPEVTRAFQHDIAGVAAVMHRPARLLLYLGIPVPFAICVAGPWLFALLFGSELEPYSWVLVGLSVLVPFRFFQWVAGATLTGSDAQGRRVAGAAIALATVLIVDLTLLPRLGVAGAIIGAAAGTVVIVSVYARGVMRILGALWRGRDIARATTASIVALVVGLTIGRAFGQIPAMVGFGVAYLGAIAVSLRFLGAGTSGGRRWL